MSSPLHEFFGIECDHENRTIKKLRYYVAVHTHKNYKSTSNVDLWHCNDCDSDFCVDWGDISFKPINTDT